MKKIESAEIVREQRGNCNKPINVACEKCFNCAKIGCKFTLIKERQV